MNHAFDVDATQQSVYDVVGRERIAKVVKGINVCLLCYGQTGSGKTHTMFGPESVLSNWRTASREDHGLAIRAMSDLFAVAAGSMTDVTCSYVEVYNDQCNDLIGGQKRLPMREGPHGAPYVEGLAEERVSSLDGAMEALAGGYL